jgi:hypothetical protein
LASAAEKAETGHKYLETAHKVMEKAYIGYETAKEAYKLYSPSAEAVEKGVEKIYNLKDAIKEGKEVAEHSPVGKGLAAAGNVLTLAQAVPHMGHGIYKMAAPGSSMAEVDAGARETLKGSASLLLAAAGPIGAGVDYAGTKIAHAAGYKGDFTDLVAEGGQKYVADAGGRAGTEVYKGVEGVKKMAHGDIKGGIGDAAELAKDVALYTNPITAGPMLAADAGKFVGKKIAEIPAVQHAAEVVKETAIKLEQKGVEKAKELGHEGAEVAKHVGHKVVETAKEVKDGVVAGAKEVKEAAVHTAKEVKDVAVAAKDAVVAEAKDIKDGVVAGAKEVKDVAVAAKDAVVSEVKDVAKDVKEVAVAAKDAVVAEAAEVKDTVKHGWAAFKEACAHPIETAQKLEAIAPKGVEVARGGPGL